MKTPAVFDFGAIRGDKPKQPDDPVLDLIRRLDEVIAAQREATEASRRVEAEYPHDAALAAESAAGDLDKAAQEIGEEATATIVAVYRERARRDRVRWDLEEEIMTRRATTIDGARAQLAMMLAEQKEGIAVDEWLESLAESLRAVAEREEEV